jgi:hypothetical protein
MLVVLAIAAVSAATLAQVTDAITSTQLSGTVKPPTDPGNCALVCGPKGGVCTASDGKSGDCVGSRGSCACAPHNICHLDQTSGSYAPLRVSDTAIPTHLRHGDCVIDDGQACTVDRCDPSSGCVHAPDNARCSDGLVCTSDSCDPAHGCVFSPLNCDDANACTVDTCKPGSGCVNTPTSMNCDDGNPCTEDSCDPATGECVHPAKPNGVSCDNHAPCTVGEFCGAGVCGNGHPPVCVGNPNLCIATWCNPAHNACEDVPTVCTPPPHHLCCEAFNVNCVEYDRNVACPPSTIDTVCFQNLCNQNSGTCEIGFAPGHPFLGDVCVDQNACETNADCVDNDLCTVEECRMDGQTKTCVYPRLSCNDNNACTADFCDPPSGCLHVPMNPSVACDDGVACTIEGCDPAAGCVHHLDNSRCDDGLACTIDQCSPTGCVHTPDASFCGNGVCNPPCGENAGNCPADCIGANSCQGTGACEGTTGQIGTNSCNGSGACLQNSGIVGDGSCNGGGACRANSGSIGNGSCIGVGACEFHLGNVGVGSCNGDGACGSSQAASISHGNVGNNSCNAPRACCDMGSDIATGTCNLQCACASVECCP